MPENNEPVMPSTSLDIKLKSEGVFAFPEEWKTTDQANPGMFTYLVKFGIGQISNGKICPRELTQKQLREAEDSKKKGGKKDGKKEENPGEAEKLKELMEKEEEEERKKLEEWNKLSEEEQFYSASEDCYKSSLLKFDPCDCELKVEGKAFVAFEEHLLKDGGQWIYVFKVPTANEEELTKLKKAKPKTLANANDLNPVVMRAWVDLSCLKLDSTKEATLRCKLEQVDMTEESPKPSLEKTYIKINLNLSEPIIKKIDSLKCSTIIKDPPQPAEIPADIKCVEELREQIKIALESLAMEYSAMFEKELNASEEQKINQVFINNRKNEPNRRKQQFLYDFNISGKYRVLKERLKKAIVHLCESKFKDKMNGEKSFTGVTCSMRDQFYSEIYNFLVNEYSETMKELVQEKKQILREVYVLKKQYQEKESQEHLQQFIKEGREERLERIISEYLQIGNAGYGAELYRKQIQKYPDDVTLKYEYSLYCIRNGLKSVKEVMAEGYVDHFMQYHKEDQKCQIVYVLLLIASESGENLSKAWVILREIIVKGEDSVEMLLIAVVLLEIKGKDELSQSMFIRASRIQLRKLQKINKAGKHKEEPQKSEIPSLTSSATYEEQLSNEEKDQLWSCVLNKFAEYGLFNIVEKVKSKLNDQEGLATKKQNLRICYYQQKFEECCQESEKLFMETKDIEIFNLLILSLNKEGRINQCEKFLKLGLKIASEEEKVNILLKLGYLYLQAQKYGNAKACLSKYLEKVKPSGGLSWEILGISELKIGNYEAAVKCFRFSNLSDPFNANVWLYLAEAYAGLSNLVMVNQSLNSFEKFSSREGKQKIQHFLSNLKNIKVNNFYDESMKAKIMMRSQQ